MKGAISMQEAVRAMTLTVEVTGVRAARARLWLGLKLLKLAARVIGCGIDIKAP